MIDMTIEVSMLSWQRRAPLRYEDQTGTMKDHGEAPPKPFLPSYGRSAGTLASLLVLFVHLLVALLSLRCQGGVVARVNL